MASNSNSSSPSFSRSSSCFDSASAAFMSVAFAITNVLLVLPLSLLVLLLGLRRRRSSSHSDVLTYHFAVLELIYVLGCAFYFGGQYSGPGELMLVGYYAIMMVYPGQVSFQILTCVERYVAAVHPVLYLRLRQSSGLRVRNTSISCAWLLCCLWIGVETVYYPSIPFAAIACCLVLALVVVSFCSLSVFCVLLRPGPGRAGRARAKRRAFHTIAAVAAVLWLYFLGGSVSVGLSGLLDAPLGCLLLMSVSWFSLPSSLVLPLLFLHRVGKLKPSLCPRREQ